MNANGDLVAPSIKDTENVIAWHKAKEMVEAHLGVEFKDQMYFLLLLRCEFVMAPMAGEDLVFFFDMRCWCWLW